jgi:arylsulfatase A-like enzyme
MKILFVFCDMLRANLLKNFNKNIKKNGQIDDLFNRIGGTVYTNCYTPAPDSPRSLASFHTGMYPKNNGCDVRIKWPNFYLNNNLKTIYDILFENKFEILIHSPKDRLKVGFLPPRLPFKINIYTSLDNFEKSMGKKIAKRNNIFGMISLIDYHKSIRDNGASSLGDYWGQQHLVNAIEHFFDNIDADNFDYIFIFSDHGFVLKSEKKINTLFFTHDKKTKITMFIRKKGDDKITINDKLSSIMDVFPTLQDILNITTKTKSDGISLFDNKEHESIVIEDHKDFNVSLEQVIENWAVRTKEYFYFKNLEENALFRVNSTNNYSRITQPDDILVKKLEKMIEQKSSSYKNNLKQYKILKYYKQMSESRDTYSDGQNRVKNIHNIFFKIKRKLLSNIYRRW